MPAYPYVSSLSALPKALGQFRKSMPSTVTAQTLQKFGIAPNNESYVINALRFLGLIDGDGNKVDENTAFLFGDDTTFSTGLEARLKDAYGALFTDFGDEAFDQDKAALVTWFRTTDKTSEIVGGRQAGTFKVLAALAGHGEAPAVQQAPATKSPTKKVAKTSGSNKKTSDQKIDPQTPMPGQSAPLGVGVTDTPLGLTVRVEVTLPANGTPDVYDSIFASIRKHLINRA